MTGWNHGYLGILLLIIGIIFKIYWLIFLSAVIIVDEIIQIITKRQYSGFLHIIYVRTLYKIKLVRNFNIWLDKIFGKT